MPMDKRAGTAAEALADVADGATVFISGFGGAGFPNVLIHALRGYQRLYCGSSGKNCRRGRDTHQLFPGVS